MLYAILKLIYKIGLQVFFRTFEVRNRNMIPDQGPLLLVSNHPNTFMDPVVIASLLQQPVYFLAKSTVFSSSFTSWMLRKMHLIPIKRREDAPDQPINNEEAFAACFQALADGKAIIIFPEGNSFNERRLRKLKTGTARIALGAEANTQAGVKIIPIGLNYSAPTRFRSKVFVNVGEPIHVSEYLPSYHINPVDTAITLTEDIRSCLEGLIIHTSTNEDDELTRDISMIYKDKLIVDDTQTTLDQEKEFLRSKAIIRSIEYFRQTSPGRVAAVRDKIRLYVQHLEHANLRDGILGKNNKELAKKGLLSTLYLLIGFPAFLYGLLHNYIPYIIPSLIAKNMTKEQEWYAPIMLTIGIFSFPLFYFLYMWLFWEFNTSPYLTVLYFISLPVSGFFSMSYWYTWRYTQEHWKLLNLFSTKKTAALKHMRQEIISELEVAHEEYQHQPNP